MTVRSPAPRPSRATLATAAVAAVLAAGAPPLAHASQAAPAPPTSPHRAEERPATSTTPPSPRSCPPPPSASVLLSRYRSPKVEELERQLARSAPTDADDRRLALACAAVRQLVDEGLARRAPAAARAGALDALGRLAGATELRAAGEVLAGEGSRPDFVASDPEVRRAYFGALARDADFGQPLLVDLAVREDDPIRQRALDSMPTILSASAQREVGRLLESDRELHVNRAAMIASAHGGAILIPSLVAAQYEPPQATRGDEAWIAIGKTVAYVQGVVPVVGDASGAFQPILGTVYEGSVLRIMESVVEIYRTEASAALAVVIERETGLPAPPFGYDQERWRAWYERDFPALAARHAESLAAGARAKETRVEGPRDDT